MAVNSWYLILLRVVLSREKDSEGNCKGVAVSSGRSCTASWEPLQEPGPSPHSSTCRLGRCRTHGSISWDVVSDDPGSHLGEQMGHFPGKAHHEGRSLLSCSTRAHTSGQEGCSGSLKWPRLGAILSSKMISQKPLPLFPVPRGGRNQTFGQLTELHHFPPTPPLPANPTTSRQPHHFPSQGDCPHAPGPTFVRPTQHL